jgi:glycosyltransferase involved in cell wall biosynthesis
MAIKPQRIGFVSTRLAGTDGVSLETAKWVFILEQLGHTCFFFAGECDWDAARSSVVPEAHFDHPSIQQLQLDLFDDYVRSPDTSRRVEQLKNLLKEHVHTFIKRFDLNLIVIENAMAIPMNVPLGLALTEVIAETGIPTIGHHHDFAWERSRFAVSAADDYLRAAFPSTLSSIVHVVINSYAQRQFALRTGLSSVVVPNVMDFDSPPPAPDNYTSDLRRRLNIPADAYYLLQPTRVVPRKQIERAVELVRRLDLPAVLVISHDSGDEGAEYAAFLREYIRLMDVEARFVEETFAANRGATPDGQKVYSLADAYAPADLVTYPSSMEGFGNAFLEAIYFRKPVVMSAYEIYRVDIKPKGFQVVEFVDFIADETVSQTRELLMNPDKAAAIVEHNYAVAKRHYSYRNLEKQLAALLSHTMGD